MLPPNCHNSLCSGGLLLLPMIILSRTLTWCSSTSMFPFQREYYIDQKIVLQPFVKSVHSKINHISHIPCLSCPFHCSLSATRHSEYHAKGTRWAHPGLRRCPVGLTYLLLWRKQCRCFMITDSNLVNIYILCTSYWHSYNHHNRNSKMCAGWLLVDLQFWAWRLCKV